MSEFIEATRVHAKSMKESARALEKAARVSPLPLSAGTLIQEAAIDAWTIAARLDMAVRLMEEMPPLSLPE